MVCVKDDGDASVDILEQTSLAGALQRPRVAALNNGVCGGHTCSRLGSVERNSDIETETRKLGCW